MSWQYVGAYAAMFVTSPPFLAGAGIFGTLGYLAGRIVGRFARR